jgi:hypothetical protein
MVKNSMEIRSGGPSSHAIMQGRRSARNNAGLAARLDPALRCAVAGDQAGRFIWQLVGVLDTYGSICLMALKV